MFLPFLVSFSALACSSGELTPLVLTPNKNYQLEVDRTQEIILDGGTQLPKITGIKGSTPKGKPMLTVMSGLQVLEKGQMRSYPHRISIKMNEAEKDWNRPVEVSVAEGGKTHLLSVKWAQTDKGCVKPLVK